VRHDAAKESNLPSRGLPGPASFEDWMSHQARAAPDEILRGESMPHPVLEALTRRPAGARLALVVEGGGMRGAVSGGMVMGLGELGLEHVFDAAYGASAGTLNALWLISGRVRQGMETWTNPDWISQLIRRRRLLVGRPVVDVTGLVAQRYEALSPGLFEAALNAPTELHPLATDVATGEPVDLHPLIADTKSLQLAVRASATLPLLGGPPVALDGHRLLDAGLTAAIPVRAALADGATHVLVLRSRLEGETTTPPRGAAAQFTERLLRRLDPAVAAAFRNRAERELEDEDLLARHADDPTRTPYILSIRPAPGSPVPSRLEGDVEVVRAALEAGRQALHAALV
jgi:predicted patatin/cPLA2 family phospholipase